MAYEHRESDEKEKEKYAKLCEMESIPHKEKGFVENVASFCHVSSEEAQKLWEEYSVWEKEVLKEKREYRHNRVSGSAHIDGVEECEQEAEERGEASGVKGEARETVQEGECRPGEGDAEPV